MLSHCAFPQMITLISLSLYDFFEFFLSDVTDGRLGFEIKRSSQPLTRLSAGIFQSLI